MIRKYVEVAGSGLWSKRVKGSSDLSERRKTWNVKSCKKF